MTLNQIGKTAHEHCVKVGFRGEGIVGPTKLESHALFHTEISEATEEVRNGELGYYFIVDGLKQGTDDLTTEGISACHNIHEKGRHQLLKPEGEASELADVIIRILETAHSNGWDMEHIIARKMRYNATRGHRHGGKIL